MQARQLSARADAKGAGRGVCIFIRKGITYIEHDLIGRSATDHCAVAIVTGKKRKVSTFLVTLYGNPAHRQKRFRALVHKASRLAHDNTLIVGGDFNAPHHHRGYPTSIVKGRFLMEEGTEAGMHLITDPTDPTRCGTSVTRDTTTDLTFVKHNARRIQWRNTHEDFGSDHYVLKIVVPLPERTPALRKHKITD